MKARLFQRSIPILGMVVFFTLTGTTLSWAHDGYYDRDRDGYWDGYHRFHHCEYYHHQHGYWDERNGVRVFINVGI